MILQKKLISQGSRGSFLSESNSGLIKLKKDNKIKKVVMCSGKIYFDLIEAREKKKMMKLFLSGLSNYTLSC